MENTEAAGELRGAHTGTGLSALVLSREIRLVFEDAQKTEVSADWSTCVGGTRVWARREEGLRLRGGGRTGLWKWTGRLERSEDKWHLVTLLLTTTNTYCTPPVQTQCHQILPTAPGGGHDYHRPTCNREAQSPGSSPGWHMVDTQI